LLKSRTRGIHTPPRHKKNRTKKKNGLEKFGKNLEKIWKKFGKNLEKNLRKNGKDKKGKNRNEKNTKGFA